MSVNLETQGPRRPDRREVGELQVQHEVGQPEQQAQVQDHRRRHRPGRRVSGGDARRARLPGRRVHVPRLAPPGALDRRPGRHQRGEELPRRRRHDPPPVLRHGQGRRLPLPRGQRPPPRRGQRRHHRPDGRPGRALRPRVRRPARQPLLRRRAGLAHVLRPRARPASSCCSAPTSSSPARSASAACGSSTASSWSTSSSSTAAAPASSRVTCSPARSQSHAAHAVVLAPAATATCSSSRRTRWPATSPRIWRAHRQGALLRQPVLHADPPDVHPAERRHAVEAHADVRVAAQRRPGVGAEERRRRRARRRRSPRTSATTTSSGCIRASATSRRATSRRAPRSAPSTPAAASAR